MFGLEGFEEAAVSENIAKVAEENIGLFWALLRRRGHDFDADFAFVVVAFTFTAVDSAI